MELTVGRRGNACAILYLDKNIENRSDVAGAVDRISCKSADCRFHGRSNSHQVAYNDTLNIGQSKIFHWTLSDEWTHVPGTWTLQLWKDDRRLVQQSFEMLEP